MGFVQMSLFDFIQGLPPVIETQPVSAPPQKATVQPESKPYTITRNSQTGYRVVLAPGLTTTPGKNPCLSCPDFGKNMDACSENCKARLSYLEAIGIGVSAISDEGHYGFGN